MEHFLEKLAHSISMWPDGVQWTIMQLASYTRQDAEEVCQFLNRALPKSVQESSKISREEAMQALERLKGMEFADQEQAQAQKDQLLNSALRRAKDLESSQQFDRGFQNLSYLLGDQAKQLDFPAYAELANECLRLGFKAGRNILELDAILRAFCERSLSARTVSSFEDAIDMLDAYRALLTQTPKGDNLFAALVALLEERANEYGLMDKLLELKE